MDINVDNRAYSDYWILTGQYKISILVFMLYGISRVVGGTMKRKNDEEDRLRRLEKERKDNQEKIRNWALEAKNISVNVDNVMITAVNNFKQDYTGYYDYTNMPYGRAVSFLTHFIPLSYDEDFYFFLPEKTENVYDMRENGILIAKSGIYIIYEDNSSKNDNVIQKRHLVFRDCFSYDRNENAIKLLNDERDGFKDRSLRQLFRNQKYSGLEMVINTVLEHKIPQLYNYLDMDCDNAVDIDTIEYHDDSYKRWAEIFAVLSGKEARNTLYNELKNYMNGRQGAGYAAEYINNTIDRMLGKEVINAAQNLDPLTGRQIKDGADRVVNGIFIQTKYHKNFSNLYHDCFPDGRIRYQMFGKPMKIEVPRDKYVEYCERLQKRIDAGEISNLPVGTKAEDIMIKGWATYQQAQSVAKAGTIEGIAVDAINGVRCSIPGATLSFVITYAVSIWNGDNPEVAFKSAFQTLIKVTIIGVGKGIADGQIKRLSGTTFAKNLGISDLMKEGFSETAFGIVIVVGPDMLKFFSGKISGQQAVKNIAVVGAGAASGKIVGAKLGEGIGGIVGPVGVIVGGVIGSFVAKTVLDEFIEDDSIEMFRIFKEEYLDCVTLAGLNKQELQKLAEMTVLNNDLHKILEKMYSVEDSRGFAKRLIEECVVSILEERPKVTKAMICEGFLNSLQSA